MEIWRDIKGFEEYYQISNSGRIKSKDRYVRVCKGKQKTSMGYVWKYTQGGLK